MRIARATSIRSTRTTIRGVCKGDPLLWIVGGDFNCNAGRGIYMPATSTHQSDHVLDGFFGDQNGTNFQVSSSTPARTYLQANGGEGQLVTNTYCRSSWICCERPSSVRSLPVLAQLQIERQSEVDTANIVTGKRTRRQSTRYGTNMDVDRLVEALGPQLPIRPCA